MFAKWITAIKAILAIIRELLASQPPVAAGNSPSPERAAMYSKIAEIEKEIDELECNHASAPAEVQKAFGDRLKKLFEMLMNLLSSLGGLLG